METTLRYYLPEEEDHPLRHEFTLIVAGECPVIIRPKSQGSMYDLHMDTLKAAHDEHEGPLEVTVDGVSYVFTEEQWLGIFNVTDQWLHDLMRLRIQQSDPTAEILE